MAKKTKVGKEEPKALEEPKAKKSSSVDVVDKAGNFVRTYSEKVHGVDFKEIAEGYAKKIGGKVK